MGAVEGEEWRVWSGVSVESDVSGWQVRAGEDIEYTVQ